MRKIAIILVVAALILAGCAKTPSGTKTTTTPPASTQAPKVQIHMELTDEIKAEISAAWLARNSVELDWEAKNNVGHNKVQYHGAFNDWHILVLVEDATAIAVTSELYIGHYVLSYGSPFEIYVYENGEFETLQTAYTQNMLSEEEIIAIFTYLQSAFPVE